MLMVGIPLAVFADTYETDKGGANIPMIAIPGKNYEMSKTEVTQGQWKAVMGENPSYFQECGDDCPVEQVSWADVKLYIIALNKKTGNDYRLPTEAEWEFACRGSSNDTYCGGEDADMLAWTENNSGGVASPVAGKNPNAWDLYDMSGNVWEWVEDKYDDNSDDRLLRGGSWSAEAKLACAEVRSHLDSALRLYSIGFRLARTLP